MGFRFPHPAENIGDAVRDAFNPDTPADGSLVEQLMNENNRAIEDAIQAVVYDGNPAPMPRYTSEGVVGTPLDYTLPDDGGLYLCRAWAAVSIDTYAYGGSPILVDATISISVTGGEGEGGSNSHVSLFPPSSSVSFGASVGAIWADAGRTLQVLFGVTSLDNAYGGVGDDPTGYMFLEVIRIGDVEPPA